MRNLIILRGRKDSGKTRFVHQAGLCAWHIDQKALENQYAPLQMGEDGCLASSSAALIRAEGELCDLVRSKIAKSEFIVLELSQGSPDRTDRLVREIASCADGHRYQITLVDFSCPTASQYSPMPRSSISHLPGSKALAHVRTMFDPCVDISDADGIVAIGDIHADAEGLRKALASAPSRLKLAFIFTGDYINKGSSPADTLRILKQFQDTSEHCFMLCGNHEIALETWAWRRGHLKDVFVKDTLPDLKRNEYSRQEARHFLRGLADHYHLRWKDHEILVTHGGLSGWTDRPGLLSGQQKRLGVGRPDTDIDRLWERNTRDKRKLQIHGHRNRHLLRISQCTTSFNLEGVDAFGSSQGMVMFQSNGRLRTRSFSLPRKA